MCMPPWTLDILENTESQSRGWDKENATTYNTSFT